MFHQQLLEFNTKGRSTIDITDALEDVLQSSNCVNGLCHVFIQHTSASLIVCENADPTVRKDLERFMQRLVVDGDTLFQHNAEGPDDMPAHLRSVLTQTSVTLPVFRNRLGLGTWQGVYLWEHRASKFRRRVLVSIHGEC